MLIEKLKNKKILILGFGEEGRDSFFALRKLFPEKIIGIADQKQTKKPDKNSRTHCGKDYLRALRDYDVVVKTPGIPLSKIKPFLKKGEEVTSQTELFFAHFKGTIIGVTGTKGKGTTSGLIHNILKKAGLKVFLGGNIGKPVLQQLLALRQAQGENSVFVYELSSHQLQGLKKSPYIAVFLNLFCDHLDYYKNLKEYQKAKENITLYQGGGDWLVYNADDKKVKQIAQRTNAQKTPFSIKEKNWLFSIIKPKNIPLKGDFNLLNVMAAAKVGELLGVKKDKIREGIKTFKPLPHRLEFVGRYKGVEFYDDSMATIPEVTIAALKALPKTTTILVGGSDKGSDYTGLAKEILKSKVKTLIILGKGTGEKIWSVILETLQGVKLLAGKELNSLRKPEVFFVNSMEEAVKIAYEKTGRGETCLLSPGAASFNLFRDYKERGDLFKKWVKFFYGVW